MTTDFNAGWGTTAAQDSWGAPEAWPVDTVAAPGNSYYIHSDYQYAILIQGTFHVKITQK